MTTTTVNYSMDELELMSYGMLQTQAKNAGLKWSGVKKVVLIEQLAALIQETALAQTPEVRTSETPVAIEVEEVTKESVTTARIEFIYTTAPADFDADLSCETVELLPLMNAKNRQWRKVKVNSSTGSIAERYKQNGYTFYDSDHFEAIRAYQQLYTEQTTQVTNTGSKNKEVFINPLSELKAAKPGTKVAIEIEALRNGATAEEVCTALSWKCWSHSRSSVLKLGYGLRRDDKKKFWLVEPVANIG